MTNPLRDYYKQILKRKWYRTRFIFIINRQERYNHCHYSLKCPYNTDIEAIFESREEAQSYLRQLIEKYPREEFEMVVYERDPEIEKDPDAYCTSSLKVIHKKEFGDLWKERWGFTVVTRGLLILIRFLFLFYELTRQEIYCRRGFLMIVHGRIEDPQNNRHCDPNHNDECYNCRTGN